MSPRLVLSPLAGLALALAPPAARADVVVVATDGSGDATTVSAGLALAAPGDTVLLREGSYVPLGPFEPDVVVTVDKPLALVGDGAGATIGYLRVEDIGAGQSVVIRNISMVMPLLSSVFFETVRVKDCAGTVLFEDCVLTGTASALSSTPGFPGLLVQDAGGVSLTRGAVTGGNGLDTALPLDFGISDGGPAVRVEDSRLALHHVTATGGRGGIDAFYDNGGAAGGPGLSIVSSEVYLAGGTITGGAGSDGCPPGLADDCRGGDGLVVTGATSILRTVGATLAGGAGGVLTDRTLAPSGQALEVAAGFVQQFPEQAREISSDVVLREGETGTVSFVGPPGENARLFVAFDLVYAQLGGKKGVDFMGGPTIGPIFLDTLPASGQLDLDVPVGSLGGFADVLVSIQGYSIGSEGLLLPNPTELLLVEAGL